MLDRCPGCKCHWGLFPPAQIERFDRVGKNNVKTDNYRCVECKRVYHIECIELIND
jgi:hypothetical protein